MFWATKEVYIDIIYIYTLCIMHIEQKDGQIHYVVNPIVRKRLDDYFAIIHVTTVISASLSH
jgi:hypothetical protein